MTGAENRACREKQTEVGPKPKGNTRGCVGKGKEGKLPEMRHAGDVQRLGVKVKVLVAQSCPTLCDPHGLQPARLLCPWDLPGKDTGVEVISFSRVSSQLRDRTHVSCIADRRFTI